MNIGRVLAVTVLSLGAPAVLAAQRVPGDSAAAIAVADSALAAITRGDFVALTDLMVDQATTFSVRERNGQVVYSARSRAQERATQPRQAITERGFTPRALVSGRLAMVWVPYDLYLDGQWSHCGVDLFTMLRLEAGWRIASMAWSVEQPPACQRHPDGPPRGR